MRLAIFTARLDDAARRKARTCGYTIMEVMMAASISVLVVGALLALVFQMALEQKQGLADGAVQGKAGLVEDRITQILRSMSSTESTEFLEPVSGNPSWYRKIIVAQGAGSPRQELSFNTGNGKLIHDPNRSVDGDQVTLFQADKMTALREVYFYPALKPGNLADRTTINVVLKFDDDGYSFRRATTNTFKKIPVNRYFTVKFRN